MGYLQELQEELRTLLGDLDEAKQKEVARFVGKKILESYRNGIASVRVLEAGKRVAENNRKGRRA